MPTPEQSTQTAILKWLSLQNPRARKLIIAIRNEGKRTIGGHILAKSMGLHKYASDLLLPLPNELYHGFFMEVKPDGWRCRSKKEKIHIDGQLEFIELMKEQGYWGEMVVGVNAGIFAFQRYLKLCI